jgi:DNA-binding SARP family transcriptional activator
MLKLRLLGGFHACYDQAPLPNLGPKLAQLLAYLALLDGKPVRTAVLKEVLWPESDALNVVHQSLNRLRACLGPDATRLMLEGGEVRLVLNGADVDIVAFTELSGQANNPAALRRAVDLYAGPLLDEWEGPWLHEQRDDLQIGYLDALKTLAEHEIRTENLLRAADHLQRFVHSYPEMEWGWETLIQVHCRAGSRLKALETYKLYSDYLCRQSAGQATPLRPSPRIETLMAQIRKEAQQAVTVVSRATGTRQAGAPPPAPTLPATADSCPELDGSAVPLGSRYYIERAEDGAARFALTALPNNGVTLLIKGGRQIGKTSLLARALQQARTLGANIVYTDWQNVPHAVLEGEEAFFLFLAHEFVEQLMLDADPDAEFCGRSAASSFDRFLRRRVFPAVEGPVVWAIDEADRLFPAPYRDDLFGKLRAMHNLRATTPDPWQRLTLILVYSTEASLFIRTPHASPFNVVAPLVLQDFNSNQIGELNFRYGGLLCDQELRRVRNLLGGHPFLWRRCLTALQTGERDLETILAQAEGPHGLFRDHLERIRFALGLDPELLAALRVWLRQGAPPEMESYARLCASGLMDGPAPEAMRARCRLYENYLRGYLS